MTKDNYTGFVYIWFDRKRKWYYLGSHMGHLDDGYVGSNARLQRAYKKRPEDFKRRVVYYHQTDDGKALQAEEQRWLDMMKHEELHLNRHVDAGTVRYYNVKNSAAGLTGKVASELKQSWWDSDESDWRREELSERFKTDNPMVKFLEENPDWKRVHSDEAKQKMSEAKKGKKSPMSKEQHSANTKKAWEEGKFDNRVFPEWTEERRKERSEQVKARGSTSTDYHKQRVSETMKGVPKSEEHKAKLSEASKIRESVVKTCPHCGYIGSGPAMKRWHMTNCRYQ